MINDLIRRFESRQKLPYQTIRHFRDFATENNSIRVKVTGVPFCGPESFAYLLICDRLIELRPASYLEMLKERITFERGEDSKFKSLSDEDVWFSHMEIMDDQSVYLTFLVLTFDVRERMKDYQAGSSKPATTRFESVRAGSSAVHDQKPWYGSKRYDIVDHVLKMQEAKAGTAYRSAVQEAALKA